MEMNGGKYNFRKSFHDFPWANHCCAFYLIKTKNK